MITQVKLLIDTETDCDDLTYEQYQQLESHPFWDETDIVGGNVHVYYWLEDFTKIPQTLRDVSKILGVLL